MERSDQRGGDTVTGNGQGLGPGTIVRRLVRSVGYAALLTPAGLVALVSGPYAGTYG